jgi:hypothetical protein
MNTATVTVAYVNQPAEGKKQGNIKTDSGDYYGVPPAMLGQFSKGGKYEIAYESREYNGKTYHTVKTVKALGGAAPSSGGGGDDSAKSENIFVCGAVNALLSGMTPADVTPESIALLTNNLRMGWRRGLVPVSKPVSSGMAQKPAEPNADMDDEIPF